MEDLGIHLHHQPFNKDNSMITLGLLLLEILIVIICCIQLCRFLKHRLFLKKLVHTLIIIQMTTCIIQAIDLPSVYSRFLHEVSFVLCSLLFFSVLLLWVDFYENMKRGFRIRVLQSHTLLWYMWIYACSYLGLWLLIEYFAFGGSNEGWVLTTYTTWWHLTFYTIATVSMIHISYSIVNMLGKSCFPALTSRCLSFVRKTSRTLFFVCVCFGLRFSSTLLFAIYPHLPAFIPVVPWDSEIAFLVLYLLDRILPVVLFMILMRRVPKMTSSCSYISASDVHYSLGGINYS